MPNWRDELIEAVKTKAERDAEEAAKQRLRVQEALSTAEAALNLAKEALGFAHETLLAKSQPSSVETLPHGARFLLGVMTLAVELDPATAVIKVSYFEAKARDFDFARDRHIAAIDVEEYVGRRLVELIRTVQKASPW